MDQATYRGSEAGTLPGIKLCPTAAHTVGSNQRILMYGIVSDLFPHIKSAWMYRARLVDAIFKCSS